MTARNKYLLQATGSVAVPAAAIDVWGADEAEAIANAHELSKQIVGVYYRFDHWHTTPENVLPIARWTVKLVPEISEMVRA